MNRGACVILLLALVLSSSCTIRPKGIMSSRKMERVLLDLHKTDGAMQVAGLSYGHDPELSAYYLGVLDKHGVTQAQFDSSLVWYTDHPQLFDKIYPRVIARLEKERDALIEAQGDLAGAKSQPKPFEPKRIDSLVNPLLFPREYDMLDSLRQEASVVTDTARFVFPYEARVELR